MGWQFLFNFIRVNHKLQAVIWASPSIIIKKISSPFVFSPTKMIFSILPAVIRAYPLIEFGQKIKSTILLDPPLVLGGRGGQICAYMIYGWFSRDVHIQAAPNRNTSYTSPRWYLFVQWSIEVGWTVVSSRRCYSRKWMSLVYSR